MRSRAATLLPGKHLQARVIASVGKVLCSFCLFCNGFTDVKWIIDRPTDLPKGQEPGVSGPFLQDCPKLKCRAPSFVVKSSRAITVLNALQVH